MLNADVPLVDARRLEVERGRIERQRRVRIAAADGQILQPPPVEPRVQHARRVGDHVEDHVALRPVVEDPEAAAEDRLAFAGQVVDRADARRHPEGVAVLELVVDPLARLEGAVEAIRAGREPADEALFDGVGQRRRHALRRSSVGSIPRRTQPAPGAPPTHTGVIELRGRASIELVGQEIRGLQRRVPLRRHVVEPHAVVEREPARWASSCPARTTRCSCSAIREARTSRPAGRS